MKMGKYGSGETRLETIIGYILITGVVISLLLEVAGIILYYRTYGSLGLLMQDKTMFIQGRNFFTFLVGIFSGSIQNYSAFIMTLGMAALILTPYVMVVVSFFYFMLKRRGKYMLITGVIVTIITISLTLH